MQFNPNSTPVQPIVSLTPFLGNKWWIKARVLDKGTTRTWNNARSQGKLFSCTLMDESCAIRATFFNDAVDMFYDTIHQGNIYYISKGSVRAANKKFNSVNNEYELSFDKETIVHASHERDQGAIPAQCYNFVPVNILTQREKNTNADVLGVVRKVADVGSITMKATGTQLMKRNITIADTTGAVDLTVWDKHAESWSIPVGTVIAVKCVRISDFDGTSISMNNSSSLDVSPQIADTRKLQQWFAQTGGNDVPSISGTGRMGGDDFNSSKGRKYFSDIQDEGLGRGEKPDYIDVRCTPTFIKTDQLWYDSCKTCKKKVAPTGADGTSYRCEKCDTTMSECEPRYLCSIQTSDNVSQQWLTLFNEAGLQFFGMEAKELKAMHQSEERKGELSVIAQRLLFKPIICRLRVKEERAPDSSEDRVKCTVTKITRLGPQAEGMRSWTDECQQVLDEIAAIC